MGDEGTGDGTVGKALDVLDMVAMAGPPGAVYRIAELPAVSESHDVPVFADPDEPGNAVL